MGAAFLLAGAVGGSFFPDLPWLGIIVGLVGLGVSFIIFAGDGIPHPIMFLVCWASASIYLPPYRQAFIISVLVGWGYILLSKQTNFCLASRGFSLLGSAKRISSPIIIANPLVSLLNSKVNNPQKILAPINIIVGVASCIYMLEIIARAVR